jgi:hypothetical protein
MSSYEEASASQKELTDGGWVIAKASEDVNSLPRSTVQSDQSVWSLVTLELGMVAS